MEATKVSVIIPVFNTERYIDKCLGSVCSQSYQNIEILLMVGKCEDNSLQKCLEWQRKDDRIIVVSRKDNSLGDARNYALKIAAGKYLAYVDADDYVEIDFIEKMIAPLEQDETAAISCCGFDQVHGNLVMNGWIPNREVSINLSYVRYMKEVPFGMVWLKMYRKKWILDHTIEMFDGCHEDDAYHICLAATVKKVHFVQEALYHYNIGNEESLMHGERQEEEYIPALRYAFSYLQKNDLYEENKTGIRKQIISSFTLILQKSFYEKKRWNVIKMFLQEFFPDIASEMEHAETYRIVKKEKTVLFGAGVDGRKAVDYLGREEIDYIVDNDRRKWGDTIEGIKIVPFSILKKDTNSKLILISSSTYYYEMAKQLRENGIHNYIAAKEYPVLRLLDGKPQKKRLFLFNTPQHTNIGDHAIAECEKELFRDFFPEYEVIEIREDFYAENKYYLTRYVNREDILVITGGGFLGTLWLKNGEDVVREIIMAYPHNKIIIMPQTMWFENSEYGECQERISKEIYEKADHLLLFLREHISYKRAKKLFSDKVKCVEVPDIVLSMQGFDNPIQKQRIGALCLKNDKESILKDEEKEQIVQTLKKYVYQITMTSMHAEQPVSIKFRKQAIENKLLELKGYQVVVTDALHCMIFCAVSGTPCVALDNISKKLSGVYEWIKELPYIFLASSVQDVGRALEDVLSVKKMSYRFSYDEYKAVLKRSIQEWMEKE